MKNILTNLKTLAVAGMTTAAMGLAALPAHALDKRIIVTGENSSADKPYVLTEGKTYTAEPFDRDPPKSWCNIGGAAVAVTNIMSGGVVTKPAYLVGTNITFSDNQTTTLSGGALYTKGWVTLSHAVFTNNTAAAQGGAFFAWTGSVTLDNGATFIGNKHNNASGCGGAVLSWQAAVKMNGNILFKDNAAVGIGGAIANQWFSELTINGDATFVNNTSAKKGGAIDNAGSKLSFTGTIDLQTDTDTWINRVNHGTPASVNWDLTQVTDPAQSKVCIKGFQRFGNELKDGVVQSSQTLTVKADGAQPAGRYVIATGDFSRETMAATNVTEFIVTNGTAGVTITPDGEMGMIGLQGYKLAVEESEAAGADQLVLSVINYYTCTRTELKKGESTNLVAGTTYTAAPTDKEGGAFSVGGGATLTGTDITFEGNSANVGGAICNTGVVTLTRAVFMGNVAQVDGGAISNGGVLNLNDVAFTNNTSSLGGAIVNDDTGTVNLLGTVSLVTTNDTFLNTGLLNWDLTGEPTGVLNGYENLINEYEVKSQKLTGTLQITVDDKITAPTNIVIATGNFSDIEEKLDYPTDWAKKDFVITNSVLGGAALTSRIDGCAVVGPTGGTFGYKLVTEAAGATTNLVLQVVTVKPRVVVTSENSPYEIKDCTYTAVKTDERGGAAYVDATGTLIVSNVTFKYNYANEGTAIYIEKGGIATFSDVTFSYNWGFCGDAAWNLGLLNLDGRVTFESLMSGISGYGYFENMGTLNWNLTDGKAGLFCNYEKLANDGGTLQITVEDYEEETNVFVIATGSFLGSEDYRDTFTITNAANGAATTAKIDGGRVVSGGSIYQLETVPDLKAESPTTNLVFTVIQPDVSKAIVNSNLAGKYKLGEDVEIRGETYYYGVNCFDEIPHDGTLVGTETLEIAGGSAAITNEVTLKAPAKLVLDDGAALSIMGEGSITNSLAATDSISGNGAIYLDKGLTDDQRKNYTDKLADGSNVLVARASVDDAAAKAKTADGFYDVDAHEKSASGEKTDTVITSDLTADGGAGAESGLAFRVTDAENLVAAGSLTATAGAAKPQTLKLVREEAATGDLTVNGKVSGFNSITVANKNEAGKMVTTSTLAANKEIMITNDGHLEAKVMAGARLEINNTSANTIIGEYSGQRVAITNTAEGVAQDITLQAYYGNINLYGTPGSVFSNVVLVAGINATPADLSANDGTKMLWIFDTNTLSGTVLAKAGLISAGTGSSLLRLENADATFLVLQVAVDTEIYGECNIASNDNGTVMFGAKSLTLKDGAVLGGKTRLVSSCDNDKFVLEGTVTLKDGAEVSRTGNNNKIVVPSGATLKLRGSKIGATVSVDGGTLDVEDGLNDISMSIENYTSINLKGGELVGGYSIGSIGILNWDLTEGTTTLDWSKVSIVGGSLVATVGNVASGTSYTLATNAAAFAETITVTNSVVGGAAATAKVGGVCCVAGRFWGLDVSEAGVLTLTALQTVRLTDVALIDKTTEPWKTNATAVVKLGEVIVDPSADGSFEVLANYPLSVIYEAANFGEEDGMMFGPGLKNKTIVIEEGIAGDSPMPADMKAQVASQCQAQWVDCDGEEGGRDIAIDTRERIVVASPNDVLPIAYSTNYWGAVESSGTVTLTAFDPSRKNTVLADAAAENGYAEWMPELGAYGRNTILQQWLAGGFIVTSNAFIYYSQPYALDWTVDGATLNVKASGLAVEKGGDVLGYDLVKFTATTNMPGYVLSRNGFKVWTNGVESAIEVTEEVTEKGVVYQFEMPNVAAEIKGGYIKATGATVNGEDIAIGSGTGWTYTSGKELSLYFKSDTTNRFELSGVIPSVEAHVTADNEATLVLNNVTNDMSSAESGCGLTIYPDNEVTVEVRGTNYFASPAGSSAVRILGSKQVTFKGDGFLNAVPGKDKTTGALLPGIGVYDWDSESCVLPSLSECQITNGTYSSTVDPSLVPWGSAEPHKAGFDNGDGTWTVKDAGVVTFYGIETDVTINALNEPIPVPAVPKKDNYVFKGWKSDGEYWEFDKPLTSAALELWADFVLLESTTPAAAVVPAGETEPVVVDTFEKAKYLAPNGGEITVSNTNPVETIDKPLIIKKANNEDLSGITAGEGLDKKVGTDGTVYIGEETNGVVVVENEAGTDDPEKVGVSVQNACDIVDPAIIDAATTNDAVKSADALVASVKVNVTPKGSDEDSMIVDLEPVLTLKTLTNGVEKATILVSTNDFALSGAPTYVKIPCYGLDPVAVVHTHGGETEVLRRTNDPMPAVGWFVYNAVAKTVTIALTQFSPVAILGAETTEYLNGSQSGSKAAGSFVATDVTVEKEALALTATKSIQFTGTTTLNGPLTLNVDHEGAITNNRTFVWTVFGSNTNAWLNNFDQIVQGPNAAFQIKTSLDQADGTYVLANHATSAAGLMFSLVGNDGTPIKTLTVPQTLYKGSRAYKLSVNDNGKLVYSIGPGVPYRVFTMVHPVECGNASTKTNGVDGVWTGMVVPYSQVTAIASVATNCVFDTWVGTNFFGEAVAFKDATNPTTTFTMPETNVSLYAYFKVDPKYVTEMAGAISNDANTAIAEIEKLTLSRRAKNAFDAEIASNRNVQVAVVLVAKTPAEARAARASADKAFAETLEKARTLAAVPYPIEWTVSPTNIAAGTVAVTNWARATELVPVEAIAASNWTFVAWTAYTNGFEITTNAVTNMVPVVADVFTNAETAVSAFRMPATNILIEATFEVDPLFRQAKTETVTSNALDAIGAITNMNLTAEEKQPFVDQVETVRTNAVAEIAKAETPDAVDAIVAAAVGEIGKIRAAAQEMAEREWTIEATVNPDDAGTVNVSTNRSQARKTITVTAIPATNWLFDCWTELDPTNGIVTVKTQGRAELVFTMPETNVNLVAKFMLDEAYRAKGHEAITNAAVAARAEIDTLNLSEAEKNTFDGEILAVETAALEEIKAAKTPADVESTVASAIERMKPIVKEAEEMAAREWPVTAAAEPAEGGVASVTNSSQARLAVTVTAVVTNESYAFAGWTGKDAAGKDIKFADAEKLVTTFTMPETNVDVVATFKVSADYKEAALAVLTNASSTARAEILNLPLTEAEKARYENRLNEAISEAAYQLQEAATPAAVDEIVVAATTRFAEIAEEARLWADRTWTIEAFETPEEAGTVSVTNCAKRGETVTVTATPETNCLFVSWYGLDAASNEVAFANATNLVTTFTMPETNVSILATFKMTPIVKELAAAEVTSSMKSCIATIETLALTDDEKAYFEGLIYDSGTNALAEIEAATSPKEVRTATWVTQRFTAVLQSAIQYAKRTWTIEASAEPAEFGTVSVTNSSKRWETVTVTATPASERHAFTGWTGTDAAGNEIEFADATSPVTTFTMPETNVSVKATFAYQSDEVSFSVSATNVTEGDVFAIVVNGGSLTKATQVTVSLQKNTLTSFTSTYGVDTKGNAKKCSFPLVLNWDAGDTEPKVIGFSTKAVTKKEADKFLTLQLGSEVNFDKVGTDVCTVTVKDVMEDPPEADPYVRALAWPANGGKVSGYGAIKLDSYGEYKSSKTLTATANKWATFAGWYMAKTNDANVIDLENGFITTEKKLKVGKGAEYGEGTYFAYFTDVAAVAAVNVPDATAAGASGVVCSEGDYVGTVGVKFALPVSFEDETEKGSLTVSGLPSGLSYNKKTGRIEGVPTKESEKSVKFVAKNSAGKHTATFDFAIEAMPTMSIGTFAGLLSDDADGAAHRSACGSVTFTAGKTGSLSAKVTTRQAGTRSFSVKGYNRIDENTLGIAMTNGTKEVFEATLSLTNGLFDTYIEGRAFGGEKKGTLGYYGEEGTLVAVRNSFLKSDKNEEALEVLEEFKGTYEATIFDAATNEVGSVTYKVQDNGNVKVVATLDATYDGEKKVAKKTISGTVSGGFLYNTSLRKGGTGVALRSGTYLWSSEVLFDTAEDEAVGVARYVRPNAEDKTEVVDVDEKVGTPAE